MSLKPGMYFTLTAHLSLVRQATFKVLNSHMYVRQATIKVLNSHIMWLVATVVDSAASGSHSVTIILEISNILV